MLIEEEAFWTQGESWVGYNATQDADYFISKPVLWVICPVCGEEFSPENPTRACRHFVDFVGTTVLFNDFEVEYGNY